MYKDGTMEISIIMMIVNDNLCDGNTIRLRTTEQVPSHDLSIMKLRMSSIYVHW